MATPTTAIQVEMARRAFEIAMRRPLETMRQIFYPRLLDLMFRRTFLQRPHTDDMMQMLTDMGVEPPDHQISRDPLVFKWR